MDNLSKLTKEDLKIVAKREHRQRQEAQRKERIFNARTRIIGIDKDALERDVKEKQQRQADERNEELCYAKELQNQCDIINNQLKDLKIERLRLESAVNEYRMRNQRKEQTREYDLNDPKYMEKATSFQGFQWLGEDPNNSHRLYLQKQQQKSWLEQQMDERNQVKGNTCKADADMEKLMIDHQQRLDEIDESERRLRHEVQRKTALYNSELAQQKKLKEIQLKHQRENDNLAEIMNNLTSDMLLETKEIAMTSNLLGGNRICVDMYRGMTDEQLHAIRVEQRQQIEEKQKKLAKEKEIEAHYDDSLRMRCKMLSLEDEEKQRKRQQLLTEQNEINARLIQEQRQRNQYLNTELYTFTPSQEYFEQFNTTTR